MICYFSFNKDDTDVDLHRLPARGTVTLSLRNCFKGDLNVMFKNKNELMDFIMKLLEGFWTIQDDSEFGGEEE